MKDTPEKPKWKRYVISAGIGLALSLLLFGAQGGFAATDPGERWRLVCDALFVPGALFIGIGLMAFVSQNGVFDMIRFGLMKVFSLMFTRKKRDDQPKTFYDYKVLKSQQEPASFGHILWVGLALIFLAGIALAFYSQYEPL